MKFFKNTKNNTFLRFFSYVLIPVILMMVFLIINILYSTANYKKMLKDNYSSYLSHMYTNCEMALQNIAQPIPTLEDNSNFMDVVTGRTNDPNAINAVRDKLTEIKKNNDLIDSIFILDRSVERNIITKDGIYYMPDFLTNNYKYSDYGYGYWHEYRSTQEKRYLAPTNVYTDYSANKKLILPLVFSKINNTHIHNLVIVNINLDKLLESVQSDGISKDVVMGIINRYKKTFYTNSPGFNTKFSNDFFTHIYSDKKQTFDYTINGEKSFVTTYSPNYSILGYTYVAILPQNKINEGIKPIVLSSVLLFLVAILILIFAAYISTKRIYSPIKNLASMFPAEKGEQDLIKQLRDSITDLAELAKNSTPQNLTSTLPYSQEHLIINLLNSEEDSSVPHLDEVRSENLVDFKHDYFCSIIVNLRLSDEFYDSYNAVDYNSIINGLYNIIQPCFGEKFNTFVLPSKTNTLYLLLNLPGKESEEEINNTVSYIKDLLEYDSIYISISFGIGGIHKDLKGLKVSHHKALRSVDLKDAHTLVNLEKTSSDSVPTYIFKVSDEENLSNLLLTGKTELASELIDRITDDNVKKGVPDSSIMQMHAQIIGIIFKILQIKHIEYDTENVGDYALISEAVSFSIINARDYIGSLIEKISEQSPVTSAKVDINAIINYIEDNYKDELFLDNLAETFGTTPKYLSKLIKTHLGVTFLAYLSNLRVNKAKELLTESSKNINEIYTEVGFNNRNSFTATFKKIVGLTPSEYRRLSYSKNDETES